LGDNIQTERLAIDDRVFEIAVHSNSFGNWKMQPPSDCNENISSAKIRPALLSFFSGDFISQATHVHDANQWSKDLPIPVNRNNRNSVRLDHAP